VNLRQKAGSRQGWLKILCLATLTFVFTAHGLHQCDLPDLAPGSPQSATLSAPRIPCLACTITQTASPISEFDTGENLPTAERAVADATPNAPAALLLLQLGVRAPPQF
jgi:hypothetical protein